MLLGGCGLVAAGREDGVDGPVAQRADVQRVAACGLRAFGGVGAQQPHEPETAAVALFGVGPAIEELFDECGRVRGPALRPQAMSRDGVHSEWARWAAGMCDASVVSAFSVDPQVDGDAAVLVEDLHGLGRDPNVDLAAAQRVGDAVERVADLDVVVDVDSRLAPLGVLVALGREAA